MFMTVQHYSYGGKKNKKVIDKSVVLMIIEYLGVIKLRYEYVLRTSFYILSIQLKFASIICYEYSRFIFCMHDVTASMH